MEKDKEIAVAFISDDNYAVNTAVAITSLKVNRSKNCNYHLYLIADNIEPEKIKKISSMNENGFQISIIPYKLEGEKFVKRGTYVTQTAVLKFLLADILSAVDKVIYLDGDIIVQTDLLEFYETSLGDKYAAVVRDVIAESQVPGILEKLKSGLKYYFNSGVMLLNLKKIRSDKIRNKLFAYRKEGINYYMDQDAFNMVFHGNVKYISCVYNFMTTMNEQLTEIQMEQEYCLDMSKTDAERLLEAKLVHMSGRDKPWDVRLPYVTDLFMKYYRQSPFAADDLYHPSKVSREEPENYLFPFELIEKGSDIVLWGAGKVGTVFYRQVRCSRHCKIRKWVDECYLFYARHGRPVTKPEPAILQSMDVDYFVAAVKSENFAMHIRQTLMDLGIREDQIIWRYPVCQIDKEYVDEIGQEELEMKRNIILEKPVGGG